ncbi:hypothetical protein OU997_02025 [Pseudomonas sp. SL4(2022)]|uniref:hypothetical protein n=1 Tax=Pseudomonas sp. SL4(2022) TaxID=2994661 RepID=UPI00226DEAE2|nr:hypothetical protein [Pseudomonas sp. SL4(2022)]WAC45001.1 hypothetical protein OU997_02025 [Pseudomonas sp. SL4(2022)]
MHPTSADEPTLAAQTHDDDPSTDLPAAAHSLQPRGFASLFSAAKAATRKQDRQRKPQKGIPSSHEKKIGPAPSGTRRSMGKR